MISSAEGKSTNLDLGKAQRYLTVFLARTYPEMAVLFSEPHAIITFGEKWKQHVACQKSYIYQSDQERHSNKTHEEKLFDVFNSNQELPFPRTIENS